MNWGGSTPPAIPTLLLGVKSDKACPGRVRGGEYGQRSHYLCVRPAVLGPIYFKNLIRVSPLHIMHFRKEFHTCHMCCCKEKKKVLGWCLKVRRKNYGYSNGQEVRFKWMGSVCSQSNTLRAPHEAHDDDRQSSNAEDYGASVLLQKLWA